MGNKNSVSISPSPQPHQEGVPTQDLPPNKTTPPPTQSVDLEANIQTSSTVQPISPDDTITNAISPDTLRRGFVRKVLFILMLQILVSAIAIGLTFIQGAGIREFLRDCEPLFWTMFGISLVVLFMIIGKPEIVNKVPRNYIFLFAFNICISYMLAVIAARTESDIVLFAGGFTCVAVLGTALYATFSKTDLTVLRSVLVGFIMMSVLTLVFSLIFKTRFLDVIFGGLISLICVLILAYDMKKITEKYKGKYGLDDYIMAALELYVDVVRIFLMVLGAAKGSRNNHS